MQVEPTRMYRVKDVAGHFEVSVATIYRAIESGSLDAVKLGAGRGTLRVTGAAVLACLEHSQGTRMYRVKEVAARYAVSTTTIYRAIESGRLDALKMGGRNGALRVPESALRAFEEACGLCGDVAGGELVGEVAR